MKSLIDITNLDWRGRIADRDPIRHWHKGRVTILGDAAHAPLQSLAQGACMAIEDGVTLAELIERHGDDFDAAFTELERGRALRTARIVFESRYMWPCFIPPHRRASEYTNASARCPAMMSGMRSRGFTTDTCQAPRRHFQRPRALVDNAQGPFSIRAKNCSTGVGRTCKGPEKGHSCIAIIPSATTSAQVNRVNAAICARGRSRWTRPMAIWVIIASMRTVIHFVVLVASVLIASRCERARPIWDTALISAL